MKHPSLLALAGGILVIVALCMGATSPAPPSEPSQIEELKKEVASLRQRVGSLEKQLKDRSLIIPRDHRDSPMIIRPPGPRGPVPKNWRPFDFNGMTFYVIPIDTAQRLADEAKK